MEADPLGLKELLSRGGWKRFAVGDSSNRRPAMMGEILPDPQKPNGYGLVDGNQKSGK